jgi:2',3'-cyclic-nucleotide 2'-phosphodiesterase (5'-nucleotidase family)
MYCKRFIYLLFGIIILSSCWQKKQLSATLDSAKSLAITNTVADTSSSFVLLNKYRNELNKTMNVVVGALEADLKKDKPNSTLGNMVCDAMLAKAKTLDATCSIAIANYGGLRIPYLNKGTVTLGNIYELMPFENTLTIVPLSGAWLDTICQKIAKAGGMPISGLQFSIVKDQATNILVNNAPINYQQTYTTCVNSYMAAGGDNCEFLIAMPKQNTTALIRDAIIDFIKNQNKTKLPIVQQPLQRISTQ